MRFAFGFDLNARSWGLWGDDLRSRLSNNSCGIRIDGCFRSIPTGECRSQNEGDNAHELDENVDRRTRRIFERIADRIADDGSFVRFATLATVIAAFDVFLRIIPCATGICHEDGQNDASHRDADEQTA